MHNEFVFTVRSVDKGTHVGQGKILLSTVDVVSLVKATILQVCFVNSVWVFGFLAVEIFCQALEGLT